MIAARWGLNRRLVLAAGLLAVAGSAALADALDDCRRARAPEQRFGACSDVIKSGTVSPEDKAAAYRTRAEARSEAGATADAIADFTSALALKPDSVAAFGGRARARLFAGDHDGAIADYSEALRLAPRSSSLLLERGHAHTARGDVDSAIADLSDAIRLDPKSASALNSRGLAWRRKGDLGRAHADFTAAIALNPIYALACVNRGYLAEARGQKPEAVEDLETALLIDPSLTGAKEALKRLGSTSSLTARSEQRIARGKALVEANCTRCHAVGAEGASPHPKAPEFRTLQRRHPMLALREPLTRGIAAPHDEMPRFAVTEGDIDAIVAYINNLPARN